MYDCSKTKINVDRKASQSCIAIGVPFVQRGSLLFEFDFFFGLRINEPSAVIAGPPAYCDLHVNNTQIYRKKKCYKPSQPIHRI
jgi:hypothetical protein